MGGPRYRRGPVLDRHSRRPGARRNRHGAAARGRTWTHDPVRRRRLPTRHRRRFHRRDPPHPRRRAGLPAGSRHRPLEVHRLPVRADLLGNRSPSRPPDLSEHPGTSAGSRARRGQVVRRSNGPGIPDERQDGLPRRPTAGGRARTVLRQSGERGWRQRIDQCGSGAQRAGGGATRPSRSALSAVQPRLARRRTRR